MRRFTVAEYHQMIQSGILDEDDEVELLQGYVVLKMACNPPHDGTIPLVEEALARLLPPGWHVRIQSAITLPDSEPEPDLAIVQGNKRAYLSRHPGPADIGLVIEVAESSLQRDRDGKGPMYASASLQTYWLVNLVDGCLEVRTAPSGPTAAPAYGQRVDLKPGVMVPLELGGVVVGSIAVADLLP
jgi:Uma2 family endonuclease